MHHLAHSMTKLCQGREQDNAGWEGAGIIQNIMRENIPLAKIDEKL